MSFCYLYYSWYYLLYAVFICKLVICCCSTVNLWPVNLLSSGCSYSLVLRHTTEEVIEACIEALEPVRVALTSQLRAKIITELEEGLGKHNWFNGFDISNDLPEQLTLEKWIQQAKELNATVFISGWLFKIFRMFACDL